MAGLHKASSRTQIYSTLLSTESEYCETLTVFRDQFCKPIKDDSKLPKPVLVSRNDYQKLVVFLSNLETICRLNFEFRDELKLRGPGGVGAVLEQYGKVYMFDT
jgi:hypothetical protein